MDIERQNFLKEVEVEIKQQKADSTKSNTEVTNEVIDKLYCEAVKKYGTTLEKLGNG